MFFRRVGVFKKLAEKDKDYIQIDFSAQDLCGIVQLAFYCIVRNP